ncbi:MAG: V-type ATP synthase subunit E [Caldiserica bacterium]|jgi:vacuolar-type H+-ATPase subunit E/Vma4|nr:V-type ATP synthase subunit E [Caldisericota bacterium]MDH7561759.1 V-type ATP synthase subunit E [Caldisericota bacterium]
MENLLKLLLSEAEQEKKRIQEEAESFRKNLLEKAQEEARSVIEKAEKELEEKGRLEIERAKSAYNLKEQAEILKEKTNWLERVFNEAFDRLKKFRENPRYASILELLLKEVLKDNPDYIISLNPQDLPLVQNFQKKEGIDFKIVQDESVESGVVATTPDKKVQIFNTLPHRLEKAWPHLVVEVARLLWEES